MSRLTGNMGEPSARSAGVPCRVCGWMRYTLTLRATASTKNVVLLARCSRCGSLKGAYKEIEALLRPSAAPWPG